MQRKPTVVFVYLLGTYIILQFLWWGYHLIDLTRLKEGSDEAIQKRIVMIISEGVVFLTLLLVGLWKIKDSIRKEIRIAKLQTNFMLSVTHELKTPLGATKLYLQTLLKHKLSDEKKSELLNKALEESNRLELLVEQILIASRLEQEDMPKHLSSFSLHEFLATIQQIQQSRTEMMIHVSQFEDITLISDQELLTYVLNNLIENANKYAYSEKGIEIQVFVNDVSVVISVRDFGKGIAKEHQHTLFRKFVRIGNEETRSAKGTGLGLYIAKEAAKKLGGDLTYKNTSETGACFQIHLPYEK